MRAVYSRPGDVLRGWALAWRGRAENPLAVYWDRQERQRVSQLAWYARHPWLLVLAATLSGLCVYVLLALLEEMRTSPAGGLYRSLVAGQLASAGAMVLVVALLLLALSWLLSAFQYCSRLALGFLEPQAGGGLRRSMDDLLAVSPLSEQDLLLGLLLHCLRRALLPCSTVTVLVSVLFWFWFEQIIVNIMFYGGEESAGRQLVPLLLCAAGTFAGSLLGFTNSILVLTTLSLSSRASLFPVSGAAAQTATQFVLLAMSSGIAFAGLGVDDMISWGLMDFLPGLTLSSLLLLMLALYLARRWSWLRAVLGHSLAAPLLVVLVPLFALAVLSDDTAAPAMAICGAGLLVLQCFCSSQSWPLLLWLGAQPKLALGMLGLIMLLQLLALLLLLGFARDAIQRRKWEGR